MWNLQEDVVMVDMPTLVSNQPSVRIIRKESHGLVGKDPSCTEPLRKIHNGLLNLRTESNAHGARSALQNLLSKHVPECDERVDWLKASYLIEG